VGAERKEGKWAELLLLCTIDKVNQITREIDVYTPKHMTEHLYLRKLLYTNTINLDFKRPN
jgi:hypothetical protein